MCLKMKRHLMIKLLYSAYCVFRQRLQLRSISSPDPVILNGNYFTMFWEVKGCYKIIINDSIVLAGSTNVVHFDSERVQDQMRIMFYGCKETIEKIVEIHKVNVRLNRKLELVQIQDPFKFSVAGKFIKRSPIKEFKCLSFLLPGIPRLVLVTANPLISSEYGFPSLQMQTNFKANILLRESELLK